MSKEIKCLRVPRQEGEKALALTRKLKIIQNDFRIQRDEDFLYIPLASQLPRNSLRALGEAGVDHNILTRPFQERKKQEESLVRLLKAELPYYLLTRLPRALDIVGDIAIVELPPELDAYSQTIGKAVLQMHSNVRTVLSKASAISGVYRLRELNFIAGERRTETVHKESGCKYQVDVAKAYFSPRLSHEHARVASLVKEDEAVVDLFAGVGPFAILIAKTHQNVKVYAIDANPYAFENLTTNIRLNRVVGKVRPFLGDARQIVDEKIRGVANRVIMNLPERAVNFIETACSTLKPEGGTVHFYSFFNAQDSLNQAKRRLVKAIEKSGRKADTFSIRKVRETAPYEWQTAFDISIH